MLDDNRVYDSRRVGDYLLNRASAATATIHVNQLIKLVYLCHGWTLGLLHRPLIVEDIEAWQSGPMIRRLCDKLGTGADLADRLATAPDGSSFSADEIHILDQVQDVYGKMTSMELASLTHTRGTPWDITWRRYGAGAVIAKDLIETHFAGLAETPTAKIIAP